jgi:hypothetical protein
MTDLVQRLRTDFDVYGFRLLIESADRIEQLETALAECRDAMPSPAPGERPEQSWSEAIGDPLAVPAYVKEVVARIERENAELRKQLQAEHERQARVWTEIQSQYRDHSPLSLTVEFDNGYRK